MKKICKLCKREFNKKDFNNKGKGSWCIVCAGILLWLPPKVAQKLIKIK